MTISVQINEIENEKRISSANERYLPVFIAVAARLYAPVTSIDSRCIGRSLAERVKGDTAYLKTTWGKIQRFVETMMSPSQVKEDMAQWRNGGVEKAVVKPANTRNSLQGLKIDDEPKPAEEAKWKRTADLKLVKQVHEDLEQRLKIDERTKAAHSDARKRLDKYKSIVETRKYMIAHRKLAELDKIDQEVLKAFLESIEKGPLKALMLSVWRGSEKAFPKSVGGETLEKFLKDYAPNAIPQSNTKMEQSNVDESSTSERNESIEESSASEQANSRASPISKERAKNGADPISKERADLICEKIYNAFHRFNCRDNETTNLDLVDLWTFHRCLVQTITTICEMSVTDQRKKLNELVKIISQINGITSLTKERNKTSWLTELTRLFRK